MVIKVSMWTYVHGIIKVDTFSRSDAEAIYLAQTVVNHLPKITGSERDAQYYLNLARGYNVSSSCDEFGQESNLYDDRCFCMFKTQTDVLITIDGALRDRMLKETLYETTKALSRLSSRLLVKDCLVSVSDFDQCYVFNNPKWIIDREITDWVRNKTTEVR